MAKNQAKIPNSRNLSLVKKVGDRTQFTIARFHCIYSGGLDTDVLN